MIISKTPIRISFFGGGTDYPDYFKKHGGAALSTTINKYIYISVKKLQVFSKFKYKIFYSKLENCNEIKDIEHPVIRACLNFLNINFSLEIHVIADLPARSGTGSSSSFTVGLLNALYTLKGKPVSKEKLALDAIHIEQVVLNERVGVQDQLAAAHGSLNFFELSKDSSFLVNRIKINFERKKELEENLLMFFTGLTRYAHKILEEQVSNTKNEKINPDLNKIKSMVYKGKEILSSDVSLDSFGLLLDNAWKTKKNLSKSISTSFLDDIYDRAKSSGALGGKLLGAGGGGFFIFYVNKKYHQNIRKSLSDLTEIHFNFEDDGTQIINSNNCD